MFGRQLFTRMTPEQREKHRVRERERYRNDADYRARSLAQKRKRREDPEFRAWKNAYCKRWRRTKKYGMRLGEFEERFAQQCGKCALCERNLVVDSAKQVDRPQVDHCHSTGRVRGLLCINCNTAMHLIDKVSLVKIVEYRDGLHPHGTDADSSATFGVISLDVQ